MPNVNKPGGLTPVGYLNGAPWSGQGRVYAIASTDVNAYAIGDPLTLAGGATDDGVPLVTRATAGTGNALIGALLGDGGIVNGGAFVDPSSLDSTLIPATKTRVYYVLVADDPNIVFEIQEGGAGAALTKAVGSRNFNLLSGTSNGYVSAWQLDNASAGTGATLQLKALGISPCIDNSFGAYAKWRVVINNHYFRAGTAGV